MSISVFVVAAVAAAQAAAPQAAPKWVPLQQANAAQAPVAVQPATQAVIVSPQVQSVLRAGVSVPLRVEETLNSNDKALRVGQQFRMTVANGVMLGNATVIPAGSIATGEITDIRHKGMWGKSGRINARVLNVRVGDRLIRLSGTFDDKGVTGTAGVVAAVVFVPVVGFFVTGTSAN